MDMNDYRARLARQWPVALAALLAMAPAWAQNSLSVKELLDRAQTKPQTEAVEELIRKLKRSSEKTPEPPSPPPVSAKPEPPGADIPQPPTIATVAPPLSQTEPATAPETSSLQGAVAPPDAHPAPVATTAPAPVAGVPPGVDLDIHFDYKSATISALAMDNLAVLGRAISDERLAEQTFLIAGHTDAKGGAA